MALEFEQDGPDPVPAGAEALRPPALRRARALVLSGPIIGIPALIGALAELDRLGVSVSDWNLVQGVSGGALAAVGVAYGYSPRELLRRVRTADLAASHQTDAGIPTTGRIRRWAETLGNSWSPIGATFQQLYDVGMPIYIGSTQFYRSGSRTACGPYLFGPSRTATTTIAEAAAAAVALPGLFQTTKVGQHRFGDGAVSPPLLAEAFYALDPEEVVHLTSLVVPSRPRPRDPIYDVDLFEMVRAIGLASRAPMFPRLDSARTIAIGLVDEDPLDLDLDMHVSESPTASRFDRLVEAGRFAVSRWLTQTGQAAP